jgi:hypothetical protein
MAENFSECMFKILTGACAEICHISEVLLWNMFTILNGACAEE